MKNTILKNTPKKIKIKSKMKITKNEKKTQKIKINEIIIE